MPLINNNKTALPSASLLKIASLLVALMPFSFMLGPAGFEIPMVLVGLLFCVEIGKSRNGAQLKKPWIVGAGIFWLAGIAANLISASPWEGVYQAVVFGRFIIFAVAVGVWILPDEKARLYLVVSIIAATLFIALNVFLQFGIGSDFFGNIPYPDRLTAVFNRQVPGLMVASLFLPALFFLFASGRPAHAFLYGFICCLCVLLTGERFAFAISAAGFGLFLILWVRSRPHKLLTSVVFVAVVALPLTAILATPSLFQRQVISTVETVGDILSSPYGVIWTRALDVAQDHLAVGTGLRQYRYVCAEPHYGPFFNDRGWPLCGTHPHNIYIESLVETGLVGFAGLMVFLAALGWSFARTGRQPNLRPEFWGLALFVAMKFVPFLPMMSFYNSSSAVPLWLAIGWAMAFEKDKLARE